MKARKVNGVKLALYSFICDMSTWILALVFEAMMVVKLILLKRHNLFFNLNTNFSGLRSLIMSKNILVDLSTILGAITHELSGPLGVFISCYELLNRNALSVDQVASMLSQGVEEQKKTMEILRGLSNLSAPFEEQSLLEMLSTVSSEINPNFIVDLKVPTEMYFHAPKLAYSFFWEMMLKGIDHYGVSKLEIAEPSSEKAGVVLTVIGGQLRVLADDLRNILDGKFELLGKVARFNFGLPLTIFRLLSRQNIIINLDGEADRLQIFVGI